MRRGGPPLRKERGHRAAREKNFSGKDALISGLPSSLLDWQTPVNTEGGIGPAGDSIQIFLGGVVGGIERQSHPIILFGLQEVAPGFRYPPQEIEGLGAVLIYRYSLVDIDPGRVELSTAHALVHHLKIIFISMGGLL